MTANQTSDAASHLDHAWKAEHPAEAVGRGGIDDAKGVIINAEIKSSVKLLDVVAAAVQGTKEWQLLDEQIVAHLQE
jgi:hypothetical protein